MIRRRKNREARIVDALLKRIERDVSFPITPIQKDGWRVVNCDVQTELDVYGPSQTLTISLRRVGR